MTDQNPNQDWFAQNGISAGAPSPADAPAGQPAAPAQGAAPAQPAQPEKNWFEENGISQTPAPKLETEQLTLPPGTDTRSTWQKVKDTVAGKDTALATPMGEDQSNEISGINDIIHGEFAKGGSKIWNSEKIDAKHVVPGSPVEWAIKQFNPDFHGLATKEAQAEMKAKNPNPGERPMIDIAQFVDKSKHPIGKAVAEVGQGLTSPENLAILASTDGLGLIGKSPQALKAFGVMQKMISAGFAYQALQGAYEHSKAFMDAMNNGDANEAEYQLTHALASGTMATQAGSHALEGVAIPGSKAFGAKGIVPVEHAMPLLSDVDKAVIGKTAEVVGKAATATGDFAKQKLTDAVDVMGRKIGRTDDFPTAITAAANRLGKTNGPEFKDTVSRVAPDLKAILNNDVDDKIVDPQTAADAIKQHLNSLEAPLQAEAGATKDSPEPVVPNFEDRLNTSLNKFFDDNRGKYGSEEEVESIKDRIKARLKFSHDLGNGVTAPRDANLYEAENARQGLGQYDPTDTNGFRAAASNTAKFLRGVIDESYDAKGVSNVAETRQKEFDLVNVKDALEAAQGAYQKQGLMSQIVKLFSLGKITGIVGSLAAHFFSGNIMGGLILGGTALKAANEHFTTNIGSNLRRAQGLADREQGATPTTTGSVPPVQGPGVPPPSAPPAPGQPPIPPPPTPPTPATPPAVNHALNGALSTYFGNFLNAEPYDQLMQKFVDQVADMKQDIQSQKDDPSYKPKYTQPQIDKAVKLQAQINTEHAKEHAAIEKQDNAAQAKYKKDRATWEQNKAAAEAKADEAARVQREKEEAEAAAKQKADEDAKASDDRIAHSPFMRSTESALEINGLEGRTSPQNHEHEHGHMMANVAEGLSPFAFVTDKHPDAVESGASAQVHTDVSGAEEGNKGIAQRVVGVLGGPAFDEMHHGVTLGRNTAARADILRAREILREEGGLRGNQLEKVFDALYDRAKEHVSNPEALALVNVNAPLREQGLHENFHMSPGRMEEYVKKLKGAYRNGQTPSTEGVREGDSDGEVPSGEPAGTGNGGSEQDGAVEGVRAEAARKSDGETAKPAGTEKSELRKGVVERSTGDETVDEAIRQGGGVPSGRQESFPYKDKVTGEPREYPEGAFVTEPKYGSTGVIPKHEVTAERVAAEVKRMREAHENPEKSSLKGTTSDRLVEKYGESKDPLATGFILPDGRRVAMGATDHMDAVRGVTPKAEQSPNHQQDMVDYLNRENVVRTRYRQGRGGNEVVFSVPEGGVSEEQISQMRQAVGKMGRTGNAVMEVAEGQGKSTQKEFARPSDVDQMLREIGAHPEQQVENDYGDTPGSAWEQHETHDLEGGSTFSPEGENLSGKDLYSVGSYPERTQQVKEKVTPELLEKFKAANADILSQPDHAVGTWYDPETKSNVLDITKTYRDRDEAIKAGQDANQKGIFHLNGEGFIPTGGTGEGPAVEKSSLVKGSSVPLMENPLKVKGTGENDKVNTLDVAQALNKFSKKQNPALELGEAEPEEMVARAKKIAADEAKYQLAQGKTGTEWYTEEMKDHDDALKAMRPEFEGGEPIDAPTSWPHNAKLSLFKAAEAILSSGQKPYGNFKSAIKAWDIYNETGEFPRTQPDGKSWGPRGAAAYGNAMDMLNTLVGEKGEKGAAEWLLSEHPVTELKQYNKDVKGKKDDMSPGAMILGQKRGPFMQNLHGIESAFTADMWVSRTWNRWMGTIETGPDGEGGQEIKTDSPRNGQERQLMKQSFSETADKLGLSTSSLQAVLWYYEQALYGAQGVPKESWSFRDAAQRVQREQPSQEEQESFPHGQNEGDDNRAKGFAHLVRPSTFANLTGK